MTETSFIIVVDSLNDLTTWRVGARAAGVDQWRSIGAMDQGDQISAPTSAASALDLGRSLREIGWRGEPLTLLLPSSLFICARVDTANLPRRRSMTWRHAVGFRFEEKSPITIEELTFDVVEAGAGALVVAVETRRIAEPLSMLESAGFHVDQLLPRALVVCQHVLRGSPGQHIDAVILRGEHQADIITIVNDDPTHWAWLADTASAGQVHLRNLVLTTGRPIRVIEIAASRTSEPYAQTDTTLANDVFWVGSSCDRDEPSSREASPSDLGPLTDGLLLAAVEDLRLSRSKPWVNLRRDALAPANQYAATRRPILAALFAAAFLLAVLSTIFLLRSNEWNRLAEGEALRQEQVYRQLFPKGQVPPNPKLRLQSVLQAEQGKKGLATPITHESALQNLHAVLARLPSSLRFRMLELRLESSRLHLHGQARNHADADAIATSLRTQRGFDVLPPRTERLKSGTGIGFTITGQIGAPDGNPLVTTKPVVNEASR